MVPVFKIALFFASTYVRTSRIFVEEFLERKDELFANLLEVKQEVMQALADEDVQELQAQLEHELKLMEMTWKTAVDIFGPLVGFKPEKKSSSSEPDTLGNVIREAAEKARKDVQEAVAESKQEVKLHEFPSSSRWWWGLWGSGHTNETDPCARGWQAHALVKDGSTVLVGRPQTPGCFSAVRMSDGKLDVAIYDDAIPEDVWRNARPGDTYQKAALVPGWALPFVQQIEAGEKKA